MVRRIPRDLIQVEVEFPECLSKPSLAKVVADLMKNLLHQRNQIPLQFDSISKDVKACEKVEDNEDVKENVDPVEDVSTHSRAPSRDAVRMSRQAARAAKNRAAFLKSGAKLVKEVEQLVEMVNVELEKDDLISISFMFGATPLSPREVYTIMIPQTTGNLQTNSRLGVHLFRAMVTHDQLHSLTTTRLPVSNMFTIFCKRSSPPTTSLQMLSSYSLPPITRCPRVNFIINTPNQLDEDDIIGPVVATRRLRFYSGAQSASSFNPSILDDRDARPAGNVLQVVATPLSSPANDHYRTETVLRTSRKVEQMEMCTPLVTRFGGPQRGHPTPHEVYTPRVAMELCTPHVGRGGGCTSVATDMDMCTPAVDLRTKFRQGMDFCTPAVRMKTRVSDTMQICTPAVDMSTMGSDPMQLCTPAVRCKAVLCAAARTSDCMELCTPAVGKLELNSDFDDLTDYVKHEMKDSGISSPDISGDFQEELFWFVTPTPVRGFKC